MYSEPTSLNTNSREIDSVDDVSVKTLSAFLLVNSQKRGKS